MRIVAAEQEALQSAGVAENLSRNALPLQLEEAGETVRGGDYFSVDQGVGFRQLGVAPSVASLDSASRQVASASAQLSSSSQGLAEGASVQATSIEQSSSAMEEMSAMTQQNAENVNLAKRFGTVT